MPRKRRRPQSQLPKILAVGGVVLIVFAILSLKNLSQPAALPAGPDELPEVQLDQALASHRPTLAFFHSDSCQQCILMMEIVAQVYPGFQDSVTLVDVNVYDSFNETLLRRARVRYIPTLIFYDQQGQEQTYVGVMESSRLSDTLAALAGGP